MKLRLGTKSPAAKVHDDHDYSEAETRDYFIDLLLKEAGWPLNDGRDREFPVTGMLTLTPVLSQKEREMGGKGFVDYVLYGGDDGKPLGVVEVKRTRRSPKTGEQQAKLYADCLEAMYGQRPIIFLPNGYEHWIWDDFVNASRRVQGFYKKAELELLIQRRQSRRSLADEPINDTIVERY